MTRDEKIKDFKWQAEWHAKEADRHLEQSKVFAEALEKLLAEAPAQTLLDIRVNADAAIAAARSRK